MTRDDIIRMAREADPGFEGGQDADGTMGDSIVGLEAIERFAALVAAAAVRETSAEYRLGWNDGQMMEREACAKVCEELPFEPDGESWTDGVNMCAAAIRARGQECS